MSGRAILVWKGPVDPIFYEMGYLNTQLSQASLDIVEVPKPGVVLLKQTVDQVRSSPLDYKGWALYEEQPSE